MNAQAATQARPSRHPASESSRYQLAAAVVYLHLVAATVHAGAHAAVGVGLAGVGHAVFLGAAVYLGPIVALRRARRGRTRTAALLLLASMAGALTYGILYHYVLPTPDHVSAAPDDFAGRIFRVTALGIAVLEILGCIAGALLWRSKTTE